MSNLLSKIQQDQAKKEAEKAPPKAETPDEIEAARLAAIQDADIARKEQALAEAKNLPATPVPPVVHAYPQGHAPAGGVLYRNIKGNRIIRANGSVMQTNTEDGFLHAVTEDEKNVCAYFEKLGHLELVK